MSRLSTGALVPHTRPSALRPVFLDAFPSAGGWTTKWELAEKLHASEVRIRELLREARAAGLVERGRSIPHGGSYAYLYRLTKAGVERDGTAKNPRRTPRVAASVIYAERLLPNRYEGLSGRPGPIDQACQQCGALKGVRCFDMSQRARTLPRGRRFERPRLERPHRVRRAWRGHGNNTTVAIGTTMTALDHSCPKCRAESGSPCRKMNRWGRWLDGADPKTYPHPQRRNVNRWVA
jgi:hypothetical protein